MSNGVIPSALVALTEAPEFNNNSIMFVWEASVARCRAVSPSNATARIMPGIPGCRVPVSGGVAGAFGDALFLSSNAATSVEPWMAAKCKDVKPF